MSLGTSQDKRYSRRPLASFITLTLGLLIVRGIFARNGWFPSTDGLTGKRKTWFGKPVAKENASSIWNPFAAPLPSPTPQLSKEYIHAGSGPSHDRRRKRECIAAL